MCVCVCVCVCVCTQVGRILTVDLVENSEKLYKLTVDVGGGEVRKVRAWLV